MKNNILSSLLLVCVLMITACNPFKVTDPGDPKFDIEKLKFEDYRTEKQLHEALIALFPMGVKRDVVEGVLIDRVGLLSGYTKGKEENYYITYYVQNESNELHSYGAYRLLGRGWRMGQFEYNSQSLLIKIRAQIFHGKSNPRFFTGSPVEKGKKL
uniref:Lipoprotein SmpA/OmlA domain-containing protein n=1 Tax=OCS116 cluster bacterium TaxID=2030921 RepID=A0A2A4YYY4_9PROT